MKPRVVLIVLDSVGIGALPDAGDYLDQGSNTLGNLAQLMNDFHLPNLEQMGLGNIAHLNGIKPLEDHLVKASYGRMAQLSAGKDTTTGHWEMMGLVLTEPFALFPQGFSRDIIAKYEAVSGHKPLANCPASGTEIIKQYGGKHLQTGRAILYTSADSVFQIAAHEEKIPLEELYRICQECRHFLDQYRVGRVIARPFIGQEGNFIRTTNRHDYSMVPPPHLLDLLLEHGIKVTGVGKIIDIFAGRGVIQNHYTQGNQHGLKTIENLLDTEKDGLFFANLVDFDMLYGHRRNPQGYAQALEEFDRFLPRLLAKLTGEDLLIITADHGCDPTFSAHTDHTREYVPLLVWKLDKKGNPRGKNLGTRKGFTDLACTIADFFGIKTDFTGESFYADL